MKNSNYHTPVLLKEAIDAIRVKKGLKYIDGTLGGGGHTGLILERGGQVLGIDQDDDAIKEASDRFEGRKDLIIVKGNFKDIKEIAEQNGFVNCSGILIDLGTSAHQLQDSLRGFSFKDHEKIDMRMDKSQKLSAYEILNNGSKNDLIEIFEKYGEEGEAREIVERIIRERKRREIFYADEFAKLVSNVKKRKEMGIHPATKVFQAIRIAVNDEINALKEVLNAGLNILGGHGRFAIISFHSIEDRVIKQAFKEFERQGRGIILTKKSIAASFEEIKKNKKSRSAKLRVFEKN